MCLFNRILIGLIVIAIGACFYFSAITLKTHQFWGEEFNKSTAQLKPLNERIDLCKYGKGVPNTKEYQRSLSDLEKYLRALKDIRGPYYPGCTVTSNFTGDGGTFLVSIPDLTSQVALEAEIPIATPLYAFHTKSDDATKLEYLGRFTVKGFGQEEGSPDFYAILEPSVDGYRTNERVQKALSSANGIWTIFRNMPIDKAKPVETDDLDYVQEDYNPFEVRIQYYTSQERVLQNLIARHNSQLEEMTERLGDKDDPHIKDKIEAVKEGKKEVDFCFMSQIFELDTIESNTGYKNLATMYKDFAEENQAMKDANAALAEEVRTLENKKRGYENSIRRRMKQMFPRSK